MQRYVKLSRSLSAELAKLSQMLISEDEVDAVAVATAGEGTVTVAVVAVGGGVAGEGCEWMKTVSVEAESDKSRSAAATNSVAELEHTGQGRVYGFLARLLIALTGLHSLAAFAG